MEITRLYFENILKKLPISYYAKRQIGVELDDGPASYYNPYEDSIKVSVQNLFSLFSNSESFDKSVDIEEMVRGVLYHEISHALKTPQDMMRCGVNQLERDLLNVFEDERIETLLIDYYLGVNFKKNIIILNNFHGNPPDIPQTAFEVFYNLVRFRDHENKNFKQKVVDLINKYTSLRRSTGIYECEEYKKDIYNFYLEVAKDWFEKEKPEEIKKMDPDYDSKSEAGKKETIKKMVEKEADEKEEQIKKLAGVGSGEFKETGDEGEEPKDKKKLIVISEDQGDMEPVNEEDAKKRSGDIQIAFENQTGKVTPQKMLDSEFNKFIDPELTESIKQIFDNFLSRQKNNSFASQRYSGKLDPRSVGREDWRIFTYKAEKGSIKGYDKLHLNLFIDTSGSFYSNEDKVNTILKSLTTLEQQYPFFDYDLVTCQVGETLRSKKERYIKANGGNDLDNNIKTIYNKLQRTDSFNYNIVLFDGDAFTDCRGRRAEHQKNFMTFNNSKCSIISDDDNEDAIRTYAPQAHSIFVNRCSARKAYSDMLYENILISLTKALL